MLLPLTEEGEKVNQEAITRFNGQLKYWFNDILKDIPVEVKKSFKEDKNVSLELTEFEEKDLHSFIHYSRNYELCISAVTKLVFINKEKVTKNNFPENFRQVLNEKILNKKDWKQVSIEMNLNGKEVTRKLFKKAIITLTEV